MSLMVKNFTSYLDIETYTPITVWRVDPFPIKKIIEVHPLTLWYSLQLQTHTITLYY